MGKMMIPPINWRGIGCSAIEARDDAEVAAVDP